VIAVLVTVHAVSADKQEITDATQNFCTTDAALLSTSCPKLITGSAPEMRAGLRVLGMALYQCFIVVLFWPLVTLIVCRNVYFHTNNNTLNVR
jgi:hypothetical protein